MKWEDILKQDLMVHATGDTKRIRFNLNKVDNILRQIKMVKGQSIGGKNIQQAAKQIEDKRLGEIAKQIDEWFVEVRELLHSNMQQEMDAKRPLVQTRTVKPDSSPTLFQYGDM